VYGEIYNDFWEGGVPINPAYPVLVATGYDRSQYISTAKLAPYPYVTQTAIQAKLGGLIKLIEACDDQQPPSGDINDPKVQAVYNGVIQNVVTEINGYLSAIYPTPLAQTGTVAVIQVTGLSTDGNNSVTSIQVLEAGNYAVAPATNQTPVYLRHIEPLANEHYWGPQWFNCQQGSGLTLTVTYANQSYSDESGQVLQASTVSGTPVIANGGTGYNLYDILVLTGGQSFVPGKVRQAALVLACHSFYQRKLAPDERNLFALEAKAFSESLKKIAEGEEVLDGTYKRFFSAGAMWGQRSVFNGANSL
jgi:hypothetical protein